MTPTTTSKPARPNQPPPTPPTGLTKATTELPGPSRRQIRQKIPNPTHYELFNFEPITTTATLKPNEEQPFCSVSLFDTSAPQPQNSIGIETWAKNSQPPQKSTELKFFENFEHPPIFHYLKTSQSNHPTPTVTLLTF